MVERIAVSCGLTESIGPAKPAPKRLAASVAPTVFGRLLAPTTAMTLGWNSASRLRMLIALPLRALSRMSVRQQHRNRGGRQDRSGGAAEQQLADPAMSVGAHDHPVGSLVGDSVEQRCSDVV